jgi:hypothetical protein
MLTPTLGVLVMKTTMTTMVIVTRDQTTLVTQDLLTIPDEAMEIMDILRLNPQGGPEEAEEVEEVEVVVDQVVEMAGSLHHCPSITIDHYAVIQCHQPTLSAMEQREYMRPRNTTEALCMSVCARSYSSTWMYGWYYPPALRLVKWTVNLLGNIAGASSSVNLRTG